MSRHAVVCLPPQRVGFLLQKGKGKKILSVPAQSLQIVISEIQEQV